MKRGWIMPDGTIQLVTKSESRELFKLIAQRTVFAYDLNSERRHSWNREDAIDITNEILKAADEYSGEKK